MIKVIHLDKALRGEAAYLQSIERARADARALREFAGDSAKEAVLTTEPLPAATKESTDAL